MTTKIVSWNITKRQEPWRQLLKMDADVALLQEAGDPPDDVTSRLRLGEKEHWDSHCWNSRWYESRFKNLYDRWTRVVQLSDRVDVEWLKQVSPISEAADDEFPVSGIGNVDPATHRILAAGDLNTIYDAKDDYDKTWSTGRDQTIWDRMNALGLEFLGPRYPNGRQARPAPDCMKPDTRNVVTYYSIGNSAASAERQLDYAFASRGFHDSVKVRVLNSVDEWGISDHCRLFIEVGTDSIRRSGRSSYCENRA